MQRLDHLLKVRCALDLAMTDAANKMHLLVCFYWQANHLSLGHF